MITPELGKSVIVRLKGLLGIQEEWSVLSAEVGDIQHSGGFASKGFAADGATPSKGRLREAPCTVSLSDPGASR